MKDDHNKTVYDPIPKYEAKAATDYQNKAADISVFQDWKNNLAFNPHNYAPSQLDFQKSWNELKKELGVPDKKHQKKQIAQHQDPAAKEAWSKHFAKQEQTAYQEACMHNVAGVSEVAWVPADLNCPFQKDPDTDKLLGRYVFKVQKLDMMVNNDYASCDTFEVHPDTDWVEKNTSAQYLATAQK